MQQIMIASNNQGKVKEFKALLSSFDVKVLSLSDLDEPIDVEETGETFEENAALKAEEICARTNMITIADDSGLVVDALDGRPGVYSARYAGLDKNDQHNTEKVLSELKEVPEDERTARFVCVLALAIPGKQTEFFRGICEGKITEAPIGEGGFGYDPIFYFPQKGKTLAELSQPEKNKISHRGHALEQLKTYWKEWRGGF
ncbi:XTP/dITP diphosphatase [Terrilactibacillus laevilacticus]|uniref:dITP/XTP pyrophosphatase n=1 Tax=Terrilactibacillus laevilacticus TaxID=1380157 RepID=A0ABW5PT40_9BACI|nr:XTP/dITP diphosphatase [Terrilactibacillus laevilacticus]